MGRYERLKTEIESGNGAQPLSESRYERLKKEMGESSSVSSTKTKKTKKPAPSSLDNRPKSETKKTTAAPPAPAPAKARKTNSGAVTKKSPVYIRSTKAAPAVDPSAYGYDPMVAQDLQNRAAQSKPGVMQALGARREGQTVYRVDDMPSLGTRVAGTVSGAAKTYGGSMAGLGAFALEAVKKLDESVSTSHRRAVNDAEHAREARLKLLSDSVQRRHGVGAPMTQEERDRLRKQAELDEARVRLAQEYQDKVHAPLTAASDALYRKGAEMEAAGQEDIERAKAGLGAVGRFGVDVGVAGLQMGMDYIPALLTGGSSALAPMFLRSAGGAAITGKESGADFSDRAVYALGSGALSAVTEQISNIAGPFRKMFGVGVADRIASRLVSRFGEKQTVQIMSRAAQTAAGRAALSAFGEGFEEVAEAVLQTPLQKATIDPDAKFDPVQAGYDFLVGAALGGLGGVSDTVLRNPGTQTQAPVSPETRAAEIQSIQEQAEQEAADWIESLNIPRPVDLNAVNAQADQDASAIVRDMFSQKPQTETDPLLKIIQDIQRDQQAGPGSILLNGDQLPQINQEIAKQQAAPVDVDSLLKGRARLDYEQLSPDTQAAVDRAYEQGAAGMDAEGRIFRIHPEDHIDRRDAADIGRRRSLNAFQFDHPELHRFFADAAQWLKSGMGQKGGQIESAPDVLSDGVTPSSHDRYWRTSRMQPEPVVRLLDEFGLSYAEIDKALDAIIKDKGQENYAAAKKVELVLDEMLTNGWTDLDGRYLPGIPEYVDATSKIAGSLNAEQEPDLGIMGQEIERLYGKQDAAPLTPDGQNGTIQETPETEETPYENRTRAKEEARPEGRREFLERSLRSLSGSFESGDVAFGFRTAHAQPQQIALGIRQALTDLGVPCEIIDGHVEINLDGYTQVQSVMQTACAKGKLVFIGPEVFGHPMNAAGHEAFHFWRGSNERIRFEEMLRDQIIFTSDAFMRLQQTVSEDYFGGEVFLSDELQTNNLMEEILAFISGNLHSGEHEAELRSMLRDYDAVKSAWNQLAEYGRSHPAEMPPSIQWGQETGPDLGILGREIDRLYGKSDTTPSDGLGAADAGTVNTDYDRLQAQSSEFHPEGENPARPVDVPKQDFDGRNIPKAASTVTGAEILNNADVERLQQIIADGMISFDTIHDTDAQSAARQTVSEIGFEGALERYRQAARSNVATKNNVALGQLLMDLAAQSGNESALAEIFYLYTTNSTNIAQAMQAQAMLRKLSPESQLSILQKSVNRLNEKYGTDAEISGENMRDFLNAPDEKTRREVADRIVKEAAQSVPGTFRAKYDCLRYLAMLGNPRTHIRNILGNTLFQVPVTAKNRIGAAVEAGYNLLSGGKLERTKSLTGVNPASQLAKECRADWVNAAEILGTGSKYSSDQTALWQMEQEANPFQNSNPLFKGLGKLSDMNGQLLSVEDTAAKRWIYTQSLAGYLKANGIKSISEADPQLLNRARNYAAQEAMRNTFNDHNAFSDFVAKLSALPNSENKWARRAGYVTEGLLPFKRTPANILSRAVEYSPVGAAASIADLVNRGVRGQATVESVATGIDRLAAGLTGTVLLAVGFLLNGYFSGGDDEDDKQRDFNSLTGHQSYALELENGTSVTLDWLAPEAIPFFMGVELAHAWQDGGLSWEDALNALKNMSGPMLEMSMLQGLNDVIEDASYAQYHGGNVPVAFIVSAATNYATQIFPTLFGQLERSTENRRMTTYADKNSPIAKDLQFFLGKTSQKIPGLDYHQIPYIDEWGREESSGDPISRTFNNILNPAYMSRVQIDNVEKELQRLKDTTGSSSVFPAKVDKSFKVGDEMKYLTADEYATFAKTVGQTRRDLLDRLMKQPGYKRLSDEQKAQAVASVYEYATGKGKMEVSKWKPDDSSIVKGVLKSMLPVESYILYRLNSDRDKSGSVNGAESALTLLELNGLSNQQRGKAWDALNDIKEDKNPFIGALPEAGVQSKTAIDIYDRYRELNNARMKPKDKAAEFLSYVRGLGLTSEQLKAVKNTYTFFGSYPIEW